MPQTPADSAVSTFDGFPTHQWAKWLAECRSSFGVAPRLFDRDTERWLLVNPPWVTKFRFGDPLAKLVQNKTLRNLFRNGVVAWGHIVQANIELFDAAPSRDSYTYDRPGELLFALNSKTGTPSNLERIAGELAGIKTAPNLDGERQQWADYLNEETTRVVGRRVPQHLSRSPEFYVSTTLFRRSHLPNGVLCQPILPIVFASNPPFFAMPLPHTFWPRSLLNWWSTRG